MFWQKIGNSVSDRLFRDSVIAENRCLYIYSERCSLTAFRTINKHRVVCIVSGVVAKT